MSVDEIELLRRINEDVGPVPPEVSGRARMMLRAAMAVDALEPAASGMEARRPLRQGRVVVRAGVAAGVAAAAAALALVAVPSPGHPPHPPAAATHGASVSPLVRLAVSINGSPTPAGNATLVARTTALGGGKSVTVYDLYTDNGQYFFSQTEGGLAGQVGTGHNLAGGLFAREIAAAKLAATGNVRAAGEDMAAAPDPSTYVPQRTQTTTISGADATKPGAYPGEVIGTRYDNDVWENSQDALIAGAGDPQVRAGVLQLLATLPDVTVTSGTSGGQPTLVLTAGAAEVGAGTTEQLTINATTGVPMSLAAGSDGHTPSEVRTYRVSRVTTGAIAAGTR